MHARLHSRLRPLALALCSSQNTTLPDMISNSLTAGGPQPLVECRPILYAGGACFHGLPSSMAPIAAKIGNGQEAAIRSATIRWGMTPNSQMKTRWNANSAQAVQ